MANEETNNGVPNWFVTFADLMTLLLTFFVMLISFSELKSEEKDQALMDGFQQQFGSYEVQKDVLPGQLRPRNSNLSKMAATSRLARDKTLNVASQVTVVKGDARYVEASRSATKPTLGTVLYFHEDQIELDDNQRVLLRHHAEGMRGSRQKIEIRGHTSKRQASDETKLRDNWDLSFERCRRVMQYLVEEQQIDSRMLRMTASAANEPLTMSRDNTAQCDSRVELILLDEFVHDTSKSN